MNKKKMNITVGKVGKGQGEAISFHMRRNTHSQKSHNNAQLPS